MYLSTQALAGVIVVVCLVYIVYFQPKTEERRLQEAFDAQVHAYISGLFTSRSDVGCTLSKIQSYVTCQLEQAHRLPSTQLLIEYDAPNGLRYSSHTCRNDYPLFAVLCIVQYGHEHGNSKLVAWAESLLEEARRLGIQSH